MRPVSILALYVSLWMLALLLVLPFEARSSDGEPGVRDVASGAPAGFRPRRALIRATILATLVFVPIYLNSMFGWVTPQMVEIFGAPRQ
jgi:predicted secreted protein